MEDMKDIIGKNIRILRKQRGQTQKSLAEQIGITYQQLSHIEKGGGTSTATLERIAAVLGVDMPVLIDEPEANLQKSISKYRNYVSETACQSMYAKLLTDIIKPANDIALKEYLSEVYEKIVLNAGFIRNQMCTHAGNKDTYSFTPSELLEFCQLMFVDFADHATRLAKVEPDNDNEFYWKENP